MAITDNKIINGSGLSELSSKIKSYVNSKIVDEVYVGDTAPTDPKAKLWVDTSAEPSNNSYTKSEIDIKLTQKQDTLTPGDNITIVNGVISSTASGSTEPDAYIKDASVSGNTLTLTKKDNTNIVFTPSGGSSGGSGYAFTSSQTFTDEDKLHLKEVYLNKNIHMTIDSLTVIRIFSMGSKMAYVVINANGATSNQVLVYTINWDSSGNITSDTFALLLSYYLVGNSSALSGDVITSDNWSQYISASGGGGDWSGPTVDSSMTDLYNVKQLWVIYQTNASIIMNTILRFDYDDTNTTLGSKANTNFYLNHDDVPSNQVYINYNGTNLIVYGGTILGYFYKT